MQRMKFWGIVVLGGLFLSGCTLLSGEVEQEQDARPLITKLEDASAYKQKVKEHPLAQSNADLCNKFTDFQAQVQAGEVLKQDLYTGTEYTLTVYKTANYSGFTNPQLSDYNTKCAQSAEQPRILKAFSDFLVWGVPNCSENTKLEETDPSREEFLACQKVAEELQDYLQN